MPYPKVKTHQYVGGKQSKMDVLLPHLSKRVNTYIEPCFGSGAVLLNRRRAPCEIANDADGRLIRYWRAVQRGADEVIDWCQRIIHHERELHHAHAILRGEVEVSSEYEYAAYYLASIYLAFCGVQAPQFAVTYFGNCSGKALQNFARENLKRINERINGVQFTDKDVLHFMGNLQKNIREGQDMLIYLDPPYLLQTNTNKNSYAVGGLTKEQHEEMLGMVLDYQKRNRDLRIAVSGYPSEVYDSMLTPAAGFEVVKYGVYCTMGTPTDWEKTEQYYRTECLWRNYDGGQGFLL